MPGPIRTILPRPQRMRRIRLRRPSTWWPSVSTQQDEAFRNIWQALRQHDRLQSGVPEIASRNARAETFAVCAIRLPQDDETLRSIQPLRNALGAIPFVRLAPPESMVITIQELGFLVDEPEAADETSHERIEEFIRHATLPICDFPKFEVKIGGFNSFLDTPFLDVHDDGWCFRIHHRLRDFTLLPLNDTYAYLPHIPLGHYTQSADMRDFPARMAKWRDRIYTTFRVGTVEILAVPTADPLGTPDVLHRFELGHSLGAAETINNSAPTEGFN